MGAATCTLTILGLTELRDQLLQLGAIAGKKTMARAARYAMKPVLDRARQLVPVRTGELRDALRLASTSRARGTAIVAAGVCRGREKIEGEIEIADGFYSSLVISTKRAWYWHLIEFGAPGHKPPFPARPYLRPAFDEKHAEVIDRFKQFAAQAVEQARKRNFHEE